MYNITQSYGKKILSDEDTKSNFIDFVEGQVIGIVLGAVTGGVSKLIKAPKTIAAIGYGSGIVISIIHDKPFDSDWKLDSETKKNNILAAVAYVERERQVQSDNFFKQDQLLFTKVIKNKNKLTQYDVNQFNEHVINKSLKVKNTDELKERIKVYERYKKTKKPDIYFHPRSLKLKVPVLEINGMTNDDIERITSH